MRQSEHHSSAWIDRALVALIALTLVLSAGRVISGISEHEPFSAELSLALLFALLAAAALADEISFHVHRRRLHRQR
jgi:hypothetical protein